MNYSVIYCLCLYLSVGVLELPAQKIVGGSKAEISEFPYQTSIRIYGKHFCGGSIIGKRHVLTAAHCVGKFAGAPGNISVYTGTSKSVGSSGSKHRLERIHVHPDYLGTESSSYRHDIAVITLTDEIPFNANQTEIQIPTKNIRSGDNATIVGWGIQKFPSRYPSIYLQKAQMKVIENNECTKYMPLDIKSKLKLYKEQLCGFNRKGVGVCSGDSGSPLVVKNQVVGIASFVVPCAEGYPDVYTNVFPYEKWIKAIVEKS